jgi:cytochrome c biogenesis protein CcdA
MEQIVLAWYGWLSGLTQVTAAWVEQWIEGGRLPGVMAVAFGLIGATAPCQLTTNLGALAYVSAQPGGGRPLGLVAAYVGAKVTVYTIVGALVILAGLRLDSMSIPVVVIARKALGPLMILIGLGLLRLVRLRAGFGHRLALQLQARLAGRGLRGAYLLGVAFSFAFCPTLFWLFFGLTVPLALRSAGGWTFPGLFAVGASLPLLAVAGTIGVGLAAGSGLGLVRRLEPALRRTAGVVLTVAGTHDTLVYWFL